MRKPLFHSYSVHGHLLKKWRSLTHFRRELAVNLFIGLSISIILLVFRDSPPLQEKQDAIMDWMINMSRGNAPKDGKSISPLVFLEIDEKTYRHRLWGEPLFTPRDKLLQLIRFAVEGEALIVMVDIDLSHKIFECGGNQRSLHTHDRALWDYLYEYSRVNNGGNAGTDSRRPQIILARHFREPLDGESIESCPEIRGSFLDEAVKNSPDVHWGSIRFSEGKDHAIRRWRLWAPSCDENRNPEVTPAMQLLAAAFVKQPKRQPAKIIKDLMDDLEPFKPTRCSPCALKAVSSGDAQTIRPLPLIELGQGEEAILLTPEPSRNQQRILYKMPWKLQDGEARPGQLGLLIRPVHEFLPALEKNDPIDNEWLKGSIVIIGGSYKDCRDLHPTPLGESPGALIILDSVHSLLRYGEVHPPPFIITFSIQFLLITVMSFVFTRFNGFWSTFFASIFIYSGLLPLSYWLFKSGVWLDIAIPLFAVQLRQTAAGYNKSIIQKQNPEKLSKEETV